MRWDTEIFTAHSHSTWPVVSTTHLVSTAGQYNSPCQHCWSVQLTLSALLVSTTHLVSTAHQYKTAILHYTLTLSALLVSTRWPAFITHSPALLVSTTHLVSTAGQYKMASLHYKVCIHTHLHCWSVQLTLSALLVSTRWPAFITHSPALLVSTTHLVSTAGQHKMITLPDKGLNTTVQRTVPLQHTHLDRAVAKHLDDLVRCAAEEAVASRALVLHADEHAHRVLCRL